MRFSFTKIYSLATFVILSVLLAVTLVSYIYARSVSGYLKKDLKVYNDGLIAITSLIYEFSETIELFNTIYYEDDHGEKVEIAIKHLDQIRNVLNGPAIANLDNDVFLERMKLNERKCRTVIFAYKSTYFNDPARDGAKSELLKMKSVIKDSKNETMLNCISNWKELNELSRKLQARLSIFNLLIPIMLVSGSIIILTMIFLVIKVLRSRLKTIIEAADNIRHGNVSYRINMPYKDDVGVVASSIDFMAERIEKHDEQMAEANHNLEESLELAQIADVAKSRFLASMSHEIRTPMNGVIGMTDLLMTTNLNPEQFEFVSTIRDSGNSLLSIINNILDYSKIEAGKLELSNEPFDLYVLANQSQKLMSPLAEEKGLELILDFPDIDCKYFVGDKVRIGQIINNLVSNSIKFTSSGFVKLAIIIKEYRLNSCSIDFIVSDTGIGMSKAAISSIYERFVQVESAHNRSFAGTGLGLAITKELVGLMGGDISVKSAEGKGATFTVSINLEVAQKSEVESNMILGADLQISQNLSILVVDDSLNNRTMAVKMLAKLGLHSEIAENGFEAIEMAGRKEYDIILMDIQMPKLDGLEATRQIIEKFPDKHPKIIALTANAFDEDRKDCLDAGMDDFMSKPITMQKLRSTIIRNVDDNKIIVVEPEIEALPEIAKSITDTLFGNDESSGISTDGSEIHDTAFKSKTELNAGFGIDIDKVMENVEGDTELLLDIFATFVTEASEVISNFENAIATNNSENAGRFAHILKGIAWGVGADKLKDLCLFAEKAGKKGNMQKVKELYPDIETGLEKVLSDIKHYMNQE